VKLVFDIEANGLTPDTMWCLCAHDLETGKLYEYYGDDIELFIPVLSKARELIGHNIIDYDLNVLRNLYEFIPRRGCRITDTLVLSRLSYPDRDGGHSLQSWGERFGFAKGDHTDFSSFSDSMLAYCRNDVELTVRLYNHLRTEFNGDSSSWKRAIKLEHGIAAVISEQERHGFYFNLNKANKLVKRIEHRVNSIDARLVRLATKRIRCVSTILKPFRVDGSLCVRAAKHLDRVDIARDIVCGPFSIFDIEQLNPDSPTQLKDFLLTQGWKPDQHTPTGSPKLTESSLKGLGYLGTTLIKRGSYSHRCSLVRGLIQRTREDGRIPAGANPCGTPTARMRHYGVVNIPKASDDVVLGREVRELFTVPSGRTLVGYDAKQLELRILAHYINDPEYTEVILHGDPHVFAQRAGGLPDRHSGKTLNYATLYGAGDQRIGGLVGGGKREGAIIRERLYQAIPGLKTLNKRVSNAATKGYVKGLDGRKLWLRQEHKALNTLIQGGGAIVMKWVAVRLGELAKSSSVDGFKVIDQHDEGQWELNPLHVDKFTALVHQSFEECTGYYSLRCPLHADVTAGQTWAETH